MTGAAAVALAGINAPRADAHFCSVPAEIKVGVDVMINIGVAAEAKPVQAVDIEIPDGFTLKDPVGYLGYTGTIQGKWAHFEGAEIEPYTCHYFGFGGQATKKGRLVSEIITTASDGTRQRYTDLRPISQFPAMLIFAGVKAADYTTSTPAKSGDVSIWVALAVAVAAGALVVGAAVMINRRRT
ncbi:MAG: hypothetical protein QOK28_2141 [Actinomycetota bacterium]